MNKYDSQQNQIIKKTMLLIVTLFLTVLVVSCKPKVDTGAIELINQAYEVLTLEFQEGDTMDSVTGDFRLPLFVSEYPDVALLWSSGAESIIKPQGLFAVINRPQEDTSVDLTATLSYKKETKDKIFSINVSGYTDYEFTGYYESLSGLLMDEFTVELSSMIKTKGRATGTTAQVRQIDNYEGQNYNIYTGFEAYGNREHVWPQSHLGVIKDDLHNLRAANSQVNSTRGNKFFVDNPLGGSWKVSGNGFYPGEDHIGDVARIILYIYIRYELNIQLVGQLDVFLMWHEMDPVSPFEISRNNKIYAIQSNRNPFIDYPDLVDIMFNN